jgi:hypothetical protein
MTIFRLCALDFPRDLTENRRQRKRNERDGLMKICFRCGKEIALESKPGRKDVCPSCCADLSCCRNCGFYDPGAYNQCREPQAERVLEKDRSNFCDYFRFRDSPAAGSPKESRGSARDKLQALFKK